MFADLLTRLRTDYIDLGMIHFVDEVKEYHQIMEGEFLQYALELKRAGTIRHIGMSTHNPAVGKLAAQSGVIEMILFSVNPAFDLLPANEVLDDYFVQETYDGALHGIDPARAELYSLCEQNGVGITVMKGYAGGRLFSEKTSPFGVALTPVQCIHYALTRPAVASILAGYDTVAHVTRPFLRNCHRGRKGLRERARQRPGARLARPVHLLRPLRPLPRRHRHRHGQQALRSGRHAGGSPGDAARALPAAFRQRGRLRGLQSLRSALPLRRAGRQPHGEAAKLLG